MPWWAREGAGGKHGVTIMTVSSPAGQDGIFISYRTGGGHFAAGRLHGRLAEHFGRGQVLCAPDGVRLAQNFASVINHALGSCKLLALIGGRWVTVTGRDGRRWLDNRQPANAIWLVGQPICRQRLAQAQTQPHVPRVRAETERPVAMWMAVPEPRPGLLPAQAAATLAGGNHGLECQ
jgi:hypothetical protein